MLSDTIEALERIRRDLDEALATDISRLGKTNRSALIVAGLLENYYACLETQFVRISQFFENRLSAQKWHRDLLEKMQLSIPGVRIAAISKENVGRLDELLRFRQLRRYYFQIDYDWRKIDYLVTLLTEAHPIVKRDLLTFNSFLASL